MNSEQFIALVSGENKSVSARYLRPILSIAEIPYTLAVRYRNRQYDLRPDRSTIIPAPVISIGNLTMGGTGKTPMVAWVCRLLEKRLGDFGRIGILSRGYRAPKGGLNDEGLELARTLPGVQIAQNPDRTASAIALLNSECPPAVFVLDDGFQHRKLARNLDIVLLDASNPFGFEHVCPRGLLREPVTGLKRAHIAIITRADCVSEERRAGICRRIRQLNPNILIGEAVHRPVGLVNSQGQSIPFESMAGKRVFAFCGLGNPQAFRNTVESVITRSGGSICGQWLEKDHFQYSRESIQTIMHQARKTGCDTAFCSMKDWVKCIPVLNTTPVPTSDSATTSSQTTPTATSSDQIPVFGIQIEISFLTGEHEIADAIFSTVNDAD